MVKSRINNYCSLVIRVSLTKYKDLRGSVSNVFFKVKKSHLKTPDVIAVLPAISKRSF